MPELGLEPNKGFQEAVKLLTGLASFPFLLYQACFPSFARLSARAAQAGTSRAVLITVIENLKNQSGVRGAREPERTCVFASWGLCDHLFSTALLL